MAEKDTVRLNVDVARELDDMLASIAEDNKVTKSEVLRRGIALLKASHDAVRAGKKVGVAKKNQDLDTEFIGI